MDDATLVTLVEQRVADCHGLSGGEMSEFREKVGKYYRGDKFGNEQDGRSQVVSRDVAEAIDSMLPALMKIFSSGDEVVVMEPRGAEDVEAAAQATDYANWVWNSQNPGFRIFYWWFKDALLNKYGIVKIWWDKTPRITRENYTGLTLAQLEALKTDADIEVSEESEPYPDMAATAGPMIDPQTGQPMPQPMLVDVKVTKTNRTGRIKVANVPLEEFLLSRRSVDIETAAVTGHRAKKSLSELAQMGYPKSLLDTIPSDDILDNDAEKQERFSDEDATGPGDSVEDPASRMVWVTEVCMRVDYDEDGIAELRRVCTAGHVLLDNEEVDDNPYALCTPVLMPHKAIGVSVSDQTMDLQLIKSTLQRQTLDNLYLQNAPVMGVDDSQLVDIDELLTRRVGGVVRTKGPPGNAFMPVPSQFVGAETFKMIEYMDTVREQRTGVTRYNQGLDPNSLNKTATGINIIANAAQQRLELIARCFAEGGVRTAFNKIVKLASQNHTKPQMLRLRGKWVEVDPRAWANGFDAVVTVGLGTGNKDQQLAHIMALLNVDKEIIALQGGAKGPIVTLPNLYNKLKKLAEATGLGKSVEQYYTDPAEAPPQQPQPSPEQQKMMAEEQRAQAEHGRTMEMKGLDIEAKKIDLAKADMEAKSQAKALMAPTGQPGMTGEGTEGGEPGAQPQGGDVMTLLAAIMQRFEQIDQKQDAMLATMVQAITAPKLGKRQADGSLLVQTQMPMTMQ